MWRAVQSQKSAVLLGDFRAPVLDQEKICRGLKLGARWYLARNGCQDVYSVVICLLYLHMLHLLPSFCCFSSVMSFLETKLRESFSWTRLDFLSHICLWKLYPLIGKPLCVRNYQFLTLALRNPCVNQISLSLQDL